MTLILFSRIIIIIFDRTIFKELEILFAIIYNFKRLTTLSKLIKLSTKMQIISIKRKEKNEHTRC